MPGVILSPHLDAAVLSCWHLLTQPGEVAEPAAAYSGSGYDLVTMFDCLHDMGDPVGAARHVRSTLKPDGTWMIVEPNAADRTEDNFNLVFEARP